MVIYVITGNKDKFYEIKAILPDVEQLDIDLPEIQEIDSRKIIEAKLQEAARHHSTPPTAGLMAGHQGEFIVEDTSLFLECLGGLPGPLIKWFEKAIGVAGIAEMAEHYHNSNALARTTVGYMKSDGQINFFVGELKGQIVPPRGDKDFGWGPIFQPEGKDKTFGEMEKDEKNKISMRGEALRKLQDYLKSK